MKPTQKKRPTAVERKKVADAAWSMLSEEAWLDVGEMLVRAKILNAQDIGRKGLRTALRDRCEPQKEGSAEYLRCRDALLERWRDGNRWVSERLAAERPKVAAGRKR